MPHLTERQRQYIYYCFVFFVCYVLLAAVTMRPIFSYDSYWHLQMGKDLYENNLSPWIDHYSFTYNGQEISSVPVAFQFLLYKFVSFFGEEIGFQVLKLFYVTLLFITLFIYFKKIKASPLIVLVLLPLITYIIQFRLMVRPEIFSNIFVIICLLFYIKAKESFRNKNLFHICLLLIVWSLYHSPIIGFIITFGLFLDKAIHKIFHKDENFLWKYWFIWGVVVFIIGFLQAKEPYIGKHLIVGAYDTLSGGFAKYTKEYMSASIFLGKNVIVQVAWVLSAYAAVWSLIKKQYGFAFIVLLLTYFSWATVRVLSVAMLINICIIGYYFSQISLSKSMSRIRPSVRILSLISLLLIAAVTFYYLGVEAFGSVKADKNETKKQLEVQYPDQIVSYLEEYQDGGNVLNPMRLGGYLIYNLSPDFKVYSDGRTNILYPIEFVAYNQTVLTDLNRLNETIKRYDVKYAVYENSRDAYSFLRKNSKLKLNFSDDNFMLFSSSEDKVFPLSSMLLVTPSCWGNALQGDLDREIAMSDISFAQNEYTLKHVLQFLKKYKSHDDKRLFFDAIKSDDMYSDGVRRLAAYMSMKDGSDVSISRLFSSIQVKDDFDILLNAYYLALGENYEEAEDLLYQFYVVNKFIKKSIVTFDKISLMVKVMDAFEESYEFKKFQPSYKSDLKAKLLAANYNPRKIWVFDYMCK